MNTTAEKHLAYWKSKAQVRVNQLSHGWWVAIHDPEGDECNAAYFDSIWDATAAIPRMLGEAEEEEMQEWWRHQ